MNQMKPTFKVEQFPDGVHSVPLAHGAGEGEVLGSAIVTFKDGMWTANLELTTEMAKLLGLDFAVVHTSYFNGEELRLLAKNKYVEE